MSWPTVPAFSWYDVRLLIELYSEVSFIGIMIIISYILWTWILIELPLSYHVVIYDIVLDVPEIMSSFKKARF